MHKILKLDKWDDSPYVKPSQRRESRCNIPSETTCRHILQNRLIASQPYIIRKSLSGRIADVGCAIQKIYCERRKLKSASHIADVFHHAIMIFMAVENFKYAREICYSQIQMFTNWSKKTNTTHLLKYVFQPWLHLIQINRLEGNIHDAFDKLNVLYLTNQCEVLMGENKILTQSLYQSLHQDTALFNEILSQSIMERINLYFETRQYADLITYLQNNRITFTGIHEIVIQEAQAVAYANLGEIHEAFTILSYNKGNKHAVKDPVLILREVEMRLSLGFDSYVPSALALLYTSSLHFLESNTITINHLIFILHTAYVMKMAKMSEESIRLIYACLEAASKIGDEVLKAESLMMLYDLIADTESKKVVEDLMITHYFDTQYVAVRKKMLNCFKDLIYVESKYNYDAMTPLFEELLAFDIHRI